MKIFLLVEDKFMPEMYLRPSACGPFTKNKKQI